MTSTADGRLFVFGYFKSHSSTVLIIPHWTQVCQWYFALFLKFAFIFFSQSEVDWPQIFISRLALSYLGRIRILFAHGTIIDWWCKTVHGAADKSLKPCHIWVIRWMLCFGDLNVIKMSYCENVFKKTTIVKWQF